MSERFFVDSPLAPGAVVLDGPEAHHLATVCRVRAGQPVCLFNGDGREYAGRVVSVQRRHVTVQIDSVTQSARELPFPLELAVPLPKGDRAQFLVEKLTELGVSAFVPLSTERSIVEPREARLDKLRRCVIEASKQCGRNVLMRIEPLTDWETYCRRSDLPPLRILAQPEGGAGVPAPTAGGMAIAVGPEGGFTAPEVELARAAGWEIVTLGPRILRVETAALFLAAVVGQAPIRSGSES